MINVKETLIKLFKLENMPEPEAENLTLRLAKLIFESVLTRALPTLNDVDFTKYEEIVDENQGPQILFDFLNGKVPGFEQMILEEAEKLHKKFQLK